MGWLEVSPNEEMQVGTRYRTQLTVQAPYSDALVGAIVRALRFGEGVVEATLAALRNNVDIQEVFVIPPDPNLVYGRNPVWGVGVVFKKIGDNTPLHLVIGLIVLVVVGVLGFTVISKTYEREFVKPTIDLALGILPLALAVVVALALVRR